MLVPLLAYVIVRAFSLDSALGNGVIVLATAAGAPFLPKLVQGAKGDIAFGVGLMVLLMVVTDSSLGDDGGVLRSPTTGCRRQGVDSAPRERGSFTFIG